MPHRRSIVVGKDDDYMNSLALGLRNDGGMQGVGTGLVADETASQRHLPLSSVTMTGPNKRPAPGSGNEPIPHAQHKPNFTSRRRQSSIPKLPMGPRPLDNAGSQRSVSNSVMQPFNNVRGASAVTSRDPTTNQLSINDVSRFSFPSLPSKQPSEIDEPQPIFATFLEPSFNFDDFHDNITSTEPRPNPFAIRSTAPNGTSNKFDRDQGLGVPGSPQRKIFAQPATTIPARKASGGMMLNRKPSAASSNDSRISTKSDSTPNQPNSILRGRRQSNLPPNSFSNPSNNSVKAPRKSIGPGTFVAPEIAEISEAVKERSPSLTGAKSSTDSPKTGLSLRLLNRKPENKTEEAKASRAMKTKSFLGTSKTVDPINLVVPAKTPDRPKSSSNSQHTQSQTQPSMSKRSGTPGRTTTPGTNSSSNRRMSIYATGLGARTISPTDAKRLKRMSTVPPAPPIPHSRISQAPPTPQPEPVPHRPNSIAQSPAANNRKSTTPSSSRTTPDPNRKSYSSGQSLSSSTSCNSARLSASINSRLVQNQQSSRLPTLKPRLDTSVGNGLEIAVPPVPAIPKAYESPGSDIDQPFFSARSSSLPLVDTPISASPIITTFAEAMNALETPRIPSSASRISSILQHELEPNQKVLPTANKRHTQTVRLPPLNLLPLSTPTASKIKSLKEGKLSPIEPPSTPSVLRNNANTPSTPMTASKATFFAKTQRAAEDLMRSSTSHNALRPTGLRPPSDMSPSLPVFIFDESTTTERNISPFVSSSFPKSTRELPNYMRQTQATELTRVATQPQAKPSGPRAPSFSVTPKPTVAQSPIEKPVESESAFSASALRRRLSRKRSESKSTDSQETVDDLSKYDNMPPPKLPASATWSQNLSSGANPTQKSTYIKSRRQSSLSSGNHVPERQDSFDSAMTHVSGSRPSIDSGRSLMVHSNRSGSLSSGTLFNNKPATPVQHEQVLDRDDMIAEEEMKKLASKRKDFESAARELDGLRARARSVQRMSPSTAAQVHNLNIFERGEIVDYPDIYFVGSKSAQKIVGDLSNTATNFGYDDDRGDYNIVEGDHLCYRYEVIDLLGKGSFGQVVRCIDHKTGILVAVKIIRNKKRFHQQALVEVNILQKLKEWDPTKRHSVVSFDQSFYFRNHLCISTDLLGMNLYEFIKAHDFRGFSLKLIRRFTKQLLSSLVLLQKHKVIHCDLKPENILLAHPVHSEIKVIDFGSSCFENEKVYTYIQSRFYRSPEVILGMSYGMPIDMWSVGCILAELYTGYPIFPGENEQEQLACIMEVFGPPEKHLIDKSSRRKLFFDSMGKPRLTVSSKGRRRRPSSKELRQVLKCDDEAFLDFIARCLRWDPARRLNPHDANRHEFITGIKVAPSSARRTFASAVTAPIKRVNSITAGNSNRPLPQPPGSTLKPGVSPRQDNLGLSPMKGNQRRLSTVNTFQSSAQAKRASHMAMTASQSNPNLSRVQLGQRSMSTRNDLATAAAAASLVK